jgi:hypothetical protein
MTEMLLVSRSVRPRTVGPCSEVVPIELGASSVVQNCARLGGLR